MKSSEIINKEFLALNPETDKNRYRNTPGTSSGPNLNAVQPISMTEIETSSVNKHPPLSQVTDEAPNNQAGSEDKDEVM